LSFVLVGNTILEIHGLNMTYWAILFSTACFANMLGLNISSGLNSVVSIYILIPLILVPQLLFSGVIVSFDKLHRSIASEEYVPRIGDFMISRWTYEALAVNQFVNNRYERKIFENERIMSQSTFYATTLIPKLKELNELCAEELEKGDTEELTFNYDVLVSELERIRFDWPLLASKVYIPEQTYSMLMKERINRGLEDVKRELNLIYQKQREAKDAKLKLLADVAGGEAGLLEYKQKYYNEALASQLLKKQELKQIEFKGRHYMQMRHAVFQSPLSRWGRAHFYAPNKRLGNWIIPTVWFNLCVIWLATVTLYVTLYYDLLRKLLKSVEKFRLQQIQKKLAQINS
jgi:hypothetical protein